MVNFKNLLIATSLLLGSVAAAPAPAGTLNAAAVEVRAVNGFAIESRDVNNENAIEAKPKKCKPTKRNGLERRIVHEGKDANKVADNEFVTAMQIKNNGGEATVTNLSGCTALFFYMDKTLRRVVHVLCGDEENDAEAAAKAAGGATSVTIGASSDTYFNNAQKGVKAGKPGLAVNKHTYGLSKLTDTVAITLHGKDGTQDITEGTGPRICEA